MEGINFCFGTHKVHEEAAVLLPALAEGTEGRAFLPAHELTAHDEIRAVTVHRAFVVQQVSGVFGVVEDDNILTENADTSDASYVYSL